MNKSRFKFRIWDKKNKDMICWPRAELYEELFLRADGVLCLNVDTINGDMVEADNDRFELIQSTDLQDCEGKEVFDGDILEEVSDEQVFRIEICWEDYSWILKSKPLKCGGIIRESVTQFEVGGVLARCKIIGNRFEHPELLEGKG